MTFKAYFNAVDAEHVVHTGFLQSMDLSGYTDITMLNDLTLDPDKKYAIVMGNEVKGVQQEVVNACDGCIEIPQYGTKHSLNVSVTTGIVLWEFAKKLLTF